MSVCDVKILHLAKLFSHCLDVSVVADDPELVSESVDRSDEVVYRSGSGIFCYKLVKDSIVWICEEYRLDVCVVDADMLHSVFLFVATCKLMLLDHTCHIVVYVCTNHKTILSLAVHCLGVDVVLLFVVLYQPAFVLEHLEVLCGFLVDARVIFTCSLWKVDFRLDDVVKRLLVTFGFLTSLLAV